MTPFTFPVTDVDECSMSNNCSQITNSWCDNTPGSYQCLCQRGYIQENDTCSGMYIAEDFNGMCI